MNRTISLAGVRIDCLPLEEAIARADSFLQNEKINTIETVTLKTTAEAGGSERIRACLNRASLVLPGDRMVLESAGGVPEEIIRETEEHLFFYEFVKLAVGYEKAFYVISETPEELDELLRFLEFLHSGRIKICGSCALEAFTGEEEDLINEINGAMPGVILSSLPTPRQEYFLEAHIHELLSCVWYGLSAEYDVTESRKGLKTWLNKQKSRFQMRQLRSE